MRTGKLRWSHHTGGYVYASPAIWHGLVLAGSYDQSFYAFDVNGLELEFTFMPTGTS